MSSDPEEELSREKDGEGKEKYGDDSFDVVGIFAADIVFDFIAEFVIMA